MTKSDGNTVASFSYSIYGELENSSGLVEECPFRYSTKFFDSEVKLYYYGYRFYSPELGRWINRDPIGENGGLNLYSFVSNDPAGAYDFFGDDIALDWIDDLGRFAQQIKNMGASTRAALGLSGGAAGAAVKDKVITVARTHGKTIARGSLVIAPLVIFRKQIGDLIHDTIADSYKPTGDILIGPPGRFVPRSIDKSKNPSKPLNPPVPPLSPTPGDEDELDKKADELFDKNPKDIAGSIAEPIRDLEGGTKKVPDRPLLPANHKITKTQRLAILKNLAGILQGTLKAAKGKRGGVLAGMKSITNQLQNPRFFWIDQIPEAIKALKKGLQERGENFVKELLKTMKGKRINPEPKYSDPRSLEALEKVISIIESLVK